MSLSLVYRHPGPELMDRKGIPSNDLFQNYRELHMVNKWLGGYRLTLKGLSHFLNHDRELSILDIGCGGGDMLKEIALFGRRKKLTLRLTGIDLSAAAIQYAQENCQSFSEIELVHSDVFTHLKSGNRYDICTSSLFFHHFSDKEIIELLSLMKRCCNKGFIINDLERNVLAYRSIKILTGLFSKSYLVRHDAPLSVLRGFKKDEWIKLASAAQLNFTWIKWKWAFRYLIVYNS